MSHRLIVLTHADNANLAIVATRAHHLGVKPAPSETFVWVDGDGGAGERIREALVAIPNLVVTGTREQRGFCEATASCWRIAQDAPGWVFWLEHDFAYERDVDLVPMMEVMDERSYLGQMALLRNPVNAVEHAHGGYLHIPGREYVRHVARDRVWWEHRDYWTTNPSLFRSEFARRHPWTAHARECEGRMRFEIHERDPAIRFGVWGDGTPWVKHIAPRTGFGY